MKTKTKIIAILSVVTIAAAQTSITYVNPGSSPDATDGDTIRNAFIKCNNDFTFIGGQLSTLNNSLAALGTTYDADGMALLVGLNVTNYVRYAVGTNTVGWLGCLNAESNVLQGDITALTNNVDALWGIVGGDGSGLVMPTVASPAPFPWGPEDAPWGPPTALVDFGSQMCFDSYKVPGQGGPGYGWTTGIRSDGFGTLSAYQIQGNLVDAAGNGNWAITDVNQDTVNTPYGGVPPVDITGFIPVSQNNGSWLWTAPSSLTFLHMAFENGDIYSYVNAGTTYMVVGGNLQATYLSDSYSSTPTAGMVATSQSTDGTWEWQLVPLPTGLTEYSSGGTLFGAFGGNFQASYLSDSYNSTPAAGMVATSQGTDGTWQWQMPPTLPSTLNFDSGSIYSDGSGDVYATALKAELWDSGSSAGNTGYIPTANGDGTWTWAAGATIPTTLNYDGGSITSDGSGDATFVSIYAQQLKDSGSWTGSAGYYAQANGSGGWAWTEWPYTLSYDGGAVYSDGSGNLYATVLKAELWDSGYSSGGGGQVPTANGDGTWTWQTPATGMVSGGGGSGGTMNFDGGSITSDGGGDVTIGGTASFMGGQTVIDYGSGGVQLKINGGSGYQSGGAQIDVAGTVCMTAAGEVDIGNNGSFTDPSPGYGYDVKCGGAAGGITSIGQINANGGFLLGNQTLVDSDGNVWAQTFNPISDRARKERIVPLAPTNALALALALDDYTWRFKAHTNTVGHVQPASGTEIGPMAQDWHAITGLGGGTNISMTSMSGLLLGAIQGLAQAQGIFTNAAGARFALVVNAQTNGFMFVPQ